MASAATVIRHKIIVFNLISINQSYIYYELELENYARLFNLTSSAELLIILIYKLLGPKYIGAKNYHLIVTINVYMINYFTFILFRASVRGVRNKKIQKLQSP